jgi:hypothetical protein
MGNESLSFLFGRRFLDRKRPDERNSRWHVADANKKHYGAGAQGKGDGSGAMTDLEEEILPENMVLSNRDMAQHSQERGLDGKAIHTEQYHDHAANRQKDEGEKR